MKLAWLVKEEADEDHFIVRFERPEWGAVISPIVDEELAENNTPKEPE
jgi:hypothetical protein